jgi:hypothetical protein
MNIAFLHYHLKTGGVTTVLKQQVVSLSKDCNILVISGSPPQTDFAADTAVIPELGYSQSNQKPIDSTTIAERITQVISRKFDAGCDILHVHNPTLAKNKQFLEILSALQEKKIRLFLQIHDFAEDGRPFSYYGKDYLSDCHYGVINSRDYNTLLKAGLTPQGLHLLPNMVNPVPRPPQNSAATDVILYPIRAIRRKNIGEAILLSLFFPRGEALAITLPPNSPVDTISYQDWKSFVKDQQMGVLFDAGLKRDFQNLVQSAKSIVTTSISEGFGFSYLEPWVHGKFLWGRNLPHITADFKKNGVDLSHLYKELLVPLDWFDLRALYDRWTNCVHQIGRLYKTPIAAEDIDTAFTFITQNGTIDFGLLDEYFQKKAILQATSNEKNAYILKQLNPFLTQLEDIADSGPLIAANKMSILEKYNQNGYRNKLVDIYHSVSQKDVFQRIDRKILLSEFINLNQFSLLKWCEYAGQE